MLQKKKKNWSPTNGFTAFFFAAVSKLKVRFEAVELYLSKMDF